MTGHQESSRAQRVGRAALLLAVLGLVIAFFTLGWNHVLSLSELRAHQGQLAAARDRHPVMIAAAYLLIYVAMAASAIPGALVMTVAGGAVFGLLEGAVLASFGSSIGATLALLSSRFLFRDLVRRHLGRKLDQVDRGLEREGWLYLVSLRLVPAIPFFVVDLLFGLTAFPVLRFYLVSQLAMLPATLVYVNAGTHLGELRSLAGIISPGVLGSLLLLACLPIAGRVAVRLILSRRAQRRTNDAGAV